MFPGGQQGHPWEPLKEHELPLQESFPIFQSSFLEDSDECKTVVEVRASARRGGDESRRRPGPQISQDILFTALEGIHKDY